MSRLKNDVKEQAQEEQGNQPEKSKESLYSLLFSDIYNRTKAYLSHSDLDKTRPALEQEHFLIRGEAGSGRSLLIKQLAHHLADNKEHIPTADIDTKNILIIRLNEYEYGIRSIKDLCLCILSNIKANQASDIAKHFNLDRDISWPTLIEEIKNANTRLILLIDNLDILLKQLDKYDNLFFVKNILVIEQPYYRLIASCLDSSPLAQPFVKFDIPSLDKVLANKQFTLLLRKGRQLKKPLQDQHIHNEGTSAEPESDYFCLSITAHKLEAIRYFSHANAQTLDYFYQAFLINPFQSSECYLRYVLRQYQAQYDVKMQRLSSQQQRIIHSLCCHWQAIKVGHLTQKCDLASKTISAQLTQLEKQSWIEKVPSQNKNHFYRILDKRFHISYLMRFSSPATQNLITYSLNTLSYFSLSIPYLDEHKLHQSVSSRGRLHSFSYQTALQTNEDVSQIELTALFHHAFLQQGEEEIDGQTYCDSASQYFKAHLPGERLTFLLTAASRGYEQAYLGLLSLFDLANTELEAKIAHRIQLALCLLAQNKGFAFENKLIPLYLSHALDPKKAYQLAMQNVIIHGQKTAPLLLIQASFATLLKGCCEQSQSLLRSYLKLKIDKEEQNKIGKEWDEEKAWLMELLLLFIAKQEWDFLERIMTSNEADQTDIKLHFFPIYHAFLAVKPQLSSSQKDEILARPNELSAALPILINAIHHTKKIYLE